MYLNYTSFIDTTMRLADILDIHNLKNFIEKYNSKRSFIYDESIKEIEDAVGGVIDNITQVAQKPFGELLGETLLNLLDFTSNLLIYFCNYGLNVIILAYIFFHETITGTQLSLKTSPPARLYLLIIKSIDKLKELIKKALKKLKNYIYQERRKLALIIILYLFSNGILYKILVETLIFFITYIIRMINLETYLLVFSIFQAIFTFTYPKLKYIPLWILIPLLFVALFFKAISKADYKLRKNHKGLKEFVKVDLTQTTFINGPPGTGKTLLNVSLSLASEENFIDELERKMLEFEQKYKYVNFAKIRADYKKYEQGFFKEYINWYKKLYFRQSFIISNFTIYDPIFDDNSKIWDFKYMRKNISIDIYPLEEYIVISISEFDNAEDYIYKIDNFKEFLQDLDNTNPKSSIIYIINNIMLDNIKEENNQDKVNFLTIHQSKGLEFLIVIIPGMEEGILPSSRAKTPLEIEEERRICYVALTRAKDNCIFLTNKKRFLYGKERKQKESRFLNELIKEQ